MPTFDTEEEQRAYIEAAKKALVKPDVHGYIDIVNAFTLAMFESFATVCCARYDPSTMDKMAYTEFADCRFCTHFTLQCEICPVEFVSRNLVEAVTGERICNMVSDDTYSEKIDAKYFNEKVITLIRDGGIDLMRNGGLEEWRKYALDLLSLELGTNIRAGGK